VSGIGWEERGRLIRLLMSWYAEDPDFRAELCLLGALADRVPSLPRELWRLARTPAADMPAEQYSRALDALTGRYGLERLPRVDGQPGGADFLHAWCERRRGGAVLGPEHLALAAGASGTVPYMPGLEWNPTRESGADFERRDRAARTAYVTELRAAGVNFKLLEQAAEQLRERENELDQPAFVLVNGDVRIVFDSEQAGSALQRGGLTLAYNTAEALQRVDLLAPEAAAPVGAS